MPVFETVLFSLITALYSACYVLSVFFTWSVLVYLEYISFVLVIIYTIAIMAMNYTKSDRKSVRAVTITIISVSSLVLCLFILTFIFPMISPMMLPLVALLYFIMLLVFLFVAVVNQEKRTEKKNEEIAALFQISVETVKSQKKKALQFIRDRLGDLCCLLCCFYSLPPMLKRIKEIKKFFYS